jgi:hypothetical protein
MVFMFSPETAIVVHKAVNFIAIRIKTNTLDAGVFLYQKAINESDNLLGLQLLHEVDLDSDGRLRHNSDVLAGLLPEQEVSL